MSNENVDGQNLGRVHFGVEIKKKSQKEDIWELFTYFCNAFLALFQGVYMGYTRF
jgi:hypothetical protein